MVALPSLQALKLDFGTLKPLLYMLRMRWPHQNGIAVSTSCQGDLVKMFYEVPHCSGFSLIPSKYFHHVLDLKLS